MKLFEAILPMIALLSIAPVWNVQSAFAADEKVTVTKQVCPSTFAEKRAKALADADSLKRMNKVKNPEMDKAVESVLSDIRAVDTAISGGAPEPQELLTCCNDYHCWSCGYFDCAVSRFFCGGNLSTSCGCFTEAQLLNLN